MNFIIFCIIHLLVLFSLRSEATPFIEEYPQLKGYTFSEPKSNFRLGLGIAPVSFLRSKVYSAVSIFQLHYINEHFDLELFNLTLGLTLSGGKDLQSQHFVVRMAPKWRLSRSLSIGPVGGLEAVRFPGLQSTQYKAPYTTQEEPFSSTGFIYGFMASETFDYKKDYLFRLSQIVYNQTYSVKKTNKDWDYYFVDAQIDADRGPIEPGLVLMFEFSILY